MGTDTCGSIRNPSSENNLFGLRGTLGLSSRDGIVPLSHTQDIGGPLARTVTDLILMLDATVGFDPDDPLSANSKGHIPKTYLSGVGDSSLQDVHIGILTANFGTALQDGEVAEIVRKAIERLRSMGARVSDVTIPGFDEIMQGTSVLNAEFKFDLMDFLAKYPKAPVRSLSEILAGGLYANAIDGNLRRSEEVEARETETYRASLEKREVARQRIVAAMVSQGITALAYPTLRRKPALIGEPQAGSNCQLSPTTGLPAISVPAGFTVDGLPVGMDLLGGEFSEQTLLRIAFSYEREVHPRRPPSTTP
jgi:Asp-tRNA(Asn)/Glu-tRNA(Gln) amidotransferase A subunit family amidase